MASPIEDYALLGDARGAALVDRTGSIDWLALPDFGSPASFAALLGRPEHGHWRLVPRGDVSSIDRRYRNGTLVLETEYTTAEGTVTVVDCLAPGTESPTLVRLVEGREGRVTMDLTLRIRFDYGAIIPWVRRISGRRLLAIAGPDAIVVDTPVELRGADTATVATFTVGPGDHVPFTLQWYPSHHATPAPRDAVTTIDQATAWWRDWSGRTTYAGAYADDVARSLPVLKALTHEPTGGIVAAATTSLPELVGGGRNWDYRFCWLRDATFTLSALLLAGHEKEAAAWRDWLLRAVAGDPSCLQIMYDTDGRRRLTEIELGWLPGYQGSAPVRIGNGASNQFQLDVYGEVMDTIQLARREGLAPDDEAWNIQRALLDFLEGSWNEPDDGIWEVRGPRQHFTHSRVMAWVAADRAVRAVEQAGLDGPVDQWRRLRREIHDDVLRNGVDERGVFVQHYDTTALDASLLVVPLVGFLPSDDDRVRATAEAIERELTEDGLVLRYRTEGAGADDGLDGGEGTFLLCSFWLADNLALIGRHDDATALYERLLGLRNDVGLLSEEYDVIERRLLGNFPQAFSHVAIVNTAMNLCRHTVGPADRRRSPD
jgi:GH15 family glucan-1,4-alpha-glucosidase